MPNTETVAEQKTSLRARCSLARRARSPEALSQARDLLRAVVLDELARRRWTCVAAYEPMPTEPGSVELLAALAASGVRVLVPITLADRDLDWTQRGGDGALLGLDAVVQISAVLVPALAVARDGARLGRGGGSYDRALLRCPVGAPRVALLFDDELIDSVPVDPWDVPMTHVAQPSGWTAVGPRRNTGVTSRD